MTETVIIVGGFDQMDSGKIRFIHEASRSGQLHILLFDDKLIEKITGNGPKYPFAERLYFVENIRYVKQVYSIDCLSRLQEIETLIGFTPDVWISQKSDELPEYQMAAANYRIAYRVLSDAQLIGYPEHDYDTHSTPGRKVIVTGCYDWFHTGHIRFFEEAAEYGDLYVILGHDKNLEKLKGPGHPLFPEDERQYMVGSIRFVKQALIASGHGWLDAEPEIEYLKPDGYVVNEDGDKEVKRCYCQDHGIDYIVLKREPKPGLTRRTSTDLRGF